jgi:cytochrome c oxidase subunit 1
VEDATYNLVILVTAILGNLTFPVLFAGVLLLLFDRSMGTSFYLSEIFIQGAALENVGGSPILYQHLFWFLGHPEVYIVILPAMGIVSEVMSVNSRKPIFGYRAMVYSLMAIAFLSLLVWAHHMLHRNESVYYEFLCFIYIDYSDAIIHKNILTG